MYIYLGCRVFEIFRFHELEGGEVVVKALEISVFFSTRSTQSAQKWNAFSSVNTF